MKSENVQLDIFTYTIMIEIYGNIEAKDKAIRLFESLKDLNITPTAHTWNAVLDIYAKSGDEKGVNDILKRISESGINLDGVVKYSAILRLHIKLKQPQECLKVLERMEEEGVSPNAYTYHTITMVCARYKENELLEKFLTRMEAEGNIYINVTYITLTSCCY
jgi:pentatricopeptide repeat domain-containing protein 1